MRVPDHAMPAYYDLLLGERAGPGTPVEQKRAIAFRLAERFHDTERAKAAEERFDRLHVERRAPDEVEEATFADGDPVHLPAVIGDAFGVTRSEARRLLAQGGVRIDGDPVDDAELDVPPERLDGAVLQIGRRRFRRLRRAG